MRIMIWERVVCSIPRIACLLLLGSGMAMPWVLSGQSQQSSSSAPALDPNLGRRSFMQNCSFCHLPRGNPKNPAKKTSIGPLLTGRFRGEKALSEQAVREFILRGVPEKMPGFQYGLEVKEVDALIAYLKTL